MPHHPDVRSLDPLSVTKNWRSAGGRQRIPEINPPQVHTLGIAAVTEVVFLAVGGTEDVVACAVDEEDEGGEDGAQLYVSEGEVARLEGIDKWDPGKVAYGEHEAEAVGSDIHSCKDRGLQRQT
jgi:hypothetical protein